MKECYKCKKIKDFSEYHKDNRSKDGYQAKCKACKKEWSAKRYKKDKDRITEVNKKWRENNKEKVNNIQNRWAKNNPERIKEIREKTYEKNKEKRKEDYRNWKANNKDKVRDYNKKWIEENRGYKNHLASKRRASKLNATPKWADLDKIKSIYENRPEGHHVDHIIPLKGKNVCGLHVSWNLQYLTIEENLKKNNKVL